MEITQQQINGIKNRYNIVGNSDGLNEAIRRALIASSVDISVLIIGESGTGKEVIPRIIHDHSASRKGRTYLPVNCGAIPQGTLDSELFGNAKGAYTDSKTERVGYFESADGGTIFLDEVAEMPLDVQAKLLRVLETGEFIRMGESKVRRTNIRVVAATNKDLRREVAQGRFREDLYYRLSTVQINVPPLRERGQDIWTLCYMFMHDFREKYRTQEVKWTADARQAMLDYRWPGNVRQLRNVTEQISLYESGNTINATLLKREYLPAEQETALTVPAGTGANFDYNLEREQLFQMLLAMRAELNELKQRMGSQDSGQSNVNTHPDELQRSSRTIELVRDASGRAAPSTAFPMGMRHPDEPAIVDAEDAYGEPPVKTLDQTERETIEAALRRNGGKRKRTAHDLQISERTLYRKIKQYNLE